MKSKLMRLDGILSRYGYCSRRETSRWLKAGRVRVGGKVEKTGALKAELSDVEIDGEPVEFPEGLFVAYHKPLGLVCSHEDCRGYTGARIYDHLPARWLDRNPAVTSIGRLDRETSGLLLLTDMGEEVHRWTSPKHHVEKEYELETDADIPPGAVEVFARGGLILDGEREGLKPARMELLGPRHARLVLTEGKYHQVRKMLASQGVHVVSLNRVRIGALTLDRLGLAPGEWTPVTQAMIRGESTNPDN